MIWFQFFKFIEVIFLTSHVVYSREHPMCSRGKCVFCCCWTEHSIDPRSSWFMLLCQSCLSLFIFNYIYYWNGLLKYSSCHCYCLFLLFNSVNSCCMNFGLCFRWNMFIMNCLFYNFWMSFLISSNILTYIFSGIGIATPVLLWFSWYIFFYILLLFVSLNLKCFTWGQ